VRAHMRPRDIAFRSISSPYWFGRLSMASP